MGIEIATAGCIRGGAICVAMQHDSLGFEKAERNRIDDSANANDGQE